LAAKAVIYGIVISEASGGSDNPLSHRLLNRPMK
jgi:hypothetical protein